MRHDPPSSPDQSLSPRVARARNPKGLGAYIMGWPVIGVVIITIWSSHWTFNVVQQWVIKSAYGEAAWDSGLRVADNKGHLTDGRELSSSQHFAVYTGSYLLSVPFFLGSAVALGYLNMRLHGEKFRDFAAAGRVA